MWKYGWFFCCWPCILQPCGTLFLVLGVLCCLPIGIILFLLFQSGWLLFLFLAFALAGPPILCWVGVVSVDLLDLFPLGGNVSVFAAKYDVSCRFSYMPFFQLRKVLLVLVFWESLHLDVEFFQMLLHWYDHEFLLLRLLIWWINWLIFN